MGLYPNFDVRHSNVIRYISSYSKTFSFTCDFTYFFNSNSYITILSLDNLSALQTKSKEVAYEDIYSKSHLQKKSVYVTHKRSKLTILRLVYFI